jgi:hypothetical protein
MRNMLRALLSAAALAAVGGAAQASDNAQTVTIDNVVVELSATPDGVTACLDTVHGAKLSGPYGVAINALSAPAAWDEALPKTVVAEDDYFSLPLRIDLKRRRGAAEPSRLQFEVGACQPEGMCVPVELAVDIATIAPAAKQVPCKG